MNFKWKGPQRKLWASFLRTAAGPAPRLEGPALRRNGRRSRSKDLGLFAEVGLVVLVYCVEGGPDILGAGVADDVVDGVEDVAAARR